MNRFGVDDCGPSLCLLAVSLLSDWLPKCKHQVKISEGNAGDALTDSGSSLRTTPDSQVARLHGDRCAHACAWSRRQHGDLLAAGPGFAALAAGARAGAVGNFEHHRQWLGGTQERPRCGGGEVVLVSNVPGPAGPRHGVRWPNRHGTDRGR